MFSLITKIKNSFFLYDPDFSLFSEATIIITSLVVTTQITYLIDSLIGFNMSLLEFIL